MARVVDLLRQGRCVSVVGQHGSGRTTVLDAVRDALEDAGRDVRLAPATWRWSRQWPSGTPLTAADREALLVQLDLGEVMDLGSAESDVVVVDDVERLTPRSAEVLGALARHAGVPVLLTRLPGSGPRSGAAFSASSAWVEVPLDPLPFEDLHHLLDQRLGGSLAAELTAQVLHESGGLPGLAIALLDAGLAHGSVRWTGSHWSGTAGWSRELRPLFDALLEPLSPEPRAAVAVLARTGGVPTDVAGRLLGEQAVSSLYEHGLLRTTATHDGTQVALDPPGLASHVLAQEHPRLVFDLGRAHERARADDDPRVRGLAERLVGSRPPAPPAPGGLPVDRRTTRHDLVVALDTWRASRHVRDAVRVLHLTSLDQDAEIIEAVLTQTEAPVGRPTFDEVELRSAAARWSIHRGTEPRTAAADLRSAPDAAPEVRATLRLVAYLLEAEFGSVPGDYEQVLTPSLVHPGFEGATARFVLAACHTLAGRYERAEQLLGTDRPGWPAWLDHGADLLLGLCALARGDVTAGVARGTEMRARGTASSSPSAWTGGTYVLALGLVAQGRLADARRHLLALLPTHRPWTDPLPVRQACHGTLVLLSAATAHDSLTSGLLGGAGAPARQSGVLPWGCPATVHAVRAYVDGEVEVALEALGRCAAGLRRRGLVLPGDAADLARALLGRDDDVDVPAGDGTRRLGGAYLEALLDSRTALRQHDPVGLHTAATRFAELGVLDEAARCHHLAADLFHRHGEPGRAARERAAAAAAHPRGARAPGALHQRVLSDREREIVDLVARGRTNPEIAAELFLSVRTIEGHIRQIRRKTGATDRAAIGRLGTRFA
ncbi:helix-turn-helix transcriptional regulator [Cellulomonas triticagri]|uniref:helix-turn-helix transcriptional regulator n=1 Tax=Cellulomonas triticagri TaxID=2483352 RepID=UPI00131528EC|nr:LuxR family transcriptional regulator [Cellulomonas triticagri]